MDSSHIGRYGTLSVMKTSEPTVAVAHFPIDEEEITIGRDPNCSVRLYYDTVSRLHCKIIFQERKAFLVVLGATGLTADGCTILPTASGPTTIPLANDTEIEVHRKRFRFIYPPKELRPMILSTPEPDRTRRRKTLRMSMIQSAQVFSPAPSHDPLENLRTLQSPLKPRYESPLKPTAEEEEEEDEEVVLVDGNQPSVVQDDDDDLVILENVHATPPPPARTPARTVQFTPTPQQYQTPRRKPRSSLHRAVLIRSAQRVAMKREVEIETQEAEEEMEVEEVVAPMEEVEEEPEEEDPEVEDIAEEPEPRRQLGKFMTPQVVRGSSVVSDHDRLGYSVEGPRRVRVVQPWKVRDIVIPEDSGVKREEFEPVFKKERISEEEKKAIRDRRKSALTIQDPMDMQIPGSRKMSSVVPLSPAVFVSPTKEDSKDGVREEDTAALFQRMKAMVEDIKRRKSLASPTKADTKDEADFWGTGDQNQVDMIVDKDAEEGEDLYANGVPDQDVPAHDEDMEVVPDSDDDEAEEAEVELQTTPVPERPPQQTRVPPKTPRLDGVRDMFAEPKAGPSTPAFGGMKRMFAQPPSMQTPVYGGVRDMFKDDVNNFLETPKMDGIGDMLATPAGYRIAAVDVPVDVEDEEDQVDEVKRGAAVVKKKKVVSRTGAASSEPQATTGPRRVLRNPKAAAAVAKPTKAATTVTKPTRTRTAIAEDELKKPSKPLPKSEPLRKTKSIEVVLDAPKPTLRQPVRKPAEPAIKPPAARVTRTRATHESGSEDETTPAVNVAGPSKIAAPVKRTTRTKVATTEDELPASKVKKPVARGTRAEAIKEEEPEPVKRTAVRTKIASKAMETPAAKPGKENTPDPDEEDSGETAPVPVPATRARRVVGAKSQTTVVKDEPKEVKVAPRTRVTRSRK